MRREVLGAMHSTTSVWSTGVREFLARVPMNAADREDFGYAHLVHTTPGLQSEAPAFPLDITPADVEWWAAAIGNIIRED